MGTEEYTVGSIADLISGKSTPNKPKIVQQVFQKPLKPTPEKSPQKDKQFDFQKAKKVETSRGPEQKRQVKFKPSPKTWRPNQYTKHESTPSTPQQRKRKRSENVADEPESPRIRQNDYLNAEKRIKTKENTEKEKLFSDRTVFVGNVPIKLTKLQLRKYFSKYGKVESVRVRGIAVADIRVPKKVAYIKKELHPDRSSAICYVKFTTPEEAQKALVLNGQLLEDHHLRVRLLDEKEKQDSSKAIFIGNVNFKAEDDEIWKLFEPCGKIESVRLVRDGRTGIGKGFGYVNFESSNSVELAMQMEKFVLKGRELRVSICKPNPNKNKSQQKVHNKVTKKEKREMKQTKQAENAEQNETGDNVQEKIKKKKTKKQAFGGIKIAEKKKKKKVNKGLLQKKRLVEKLLPKAKESIG